MSNDLATITVNEIGLMADAVAKSNLFGIKTRDQAMALMLVAHAEGRHPVLAARDYDIIQGKPAKKAEAMQRDFLASGGKIEWHTLSDALADATFTHPQGGTFRCTWDMNRAKEAQLSGKDMWKKYPRQMLRSRVVSEGVRTIFPAATSGMYVPEEVRDFAVKNPPVTIDQDNLDGVIRTVSQSEIAVNIAENLKSAENVLDLERVWQENKDNLTSISILLPSWYDRLIDVKATRHDYLNTQMYKQAMDNDRTEVDELEEALRIPETLRRTK